MNNGDNKRQTIAVLFGGRSVEHEISIITALQMIEAMDTVKYRPLPVYVAPTGKWYCGDELLKKEVYKNMPASLSGLKEVVLLPTPGLNSLTVIGLRSKGGFGIFGSKVAEETIPVDVFFPCFHGSYGEDGCVQGLFELADVTYTGSDVVSSALSMSKYHCKKFLESHDIPVLPSIVVSKAELDQGMGSNLAKMRERILAQPGLGNFPLFVKPATLGSSIGVSKADDAAGLDAALLKAFKYDVEAIVEPCLDDKMEINVSVMDDVEAVASVVEIPVSSSGNELTYEDKYMRPGSKKNGPASSGMAGLARVINPTDLDPKLKEQARSYAKRAFELIGCAGVARIDFMVDLKKGQLYFNEINPLPGSLSYYLWVNSEPAVLYTDMITLMIERAQLRKKRKASVSVDIGFKALFK
ncbi:MAG: D-alanine--D-alanine ligase [Candidatus Obscuribacterales bacterium]|nr:D-alanine--D-alanine ligase [Candidatus Obscuribacterales bacterium]